MKKYILIYTLLFSFLMSAQEVQLSWNKDYNVATELSKAENKPILIYFTKSDCKECQEFYIDFFEGEDFKTLSDKFVLLMLDGSDTDTKTNDISVIKNRRLVMHYNKSLTFPAVLMLNTERQSIGELFTSKDKTTIETYFTFLETNK